MNTELHTKRHAELHAVLDELVADWLLETGRLPSKSTVWDLIEWSNKQAQGGEAKPTPVIVVEQLDAKERLQRVFGHAVDYGADNDNHWTDMAEHVKNITLVMNPKSAVTIPPWLTPAEFVVVSLAEIEKCACEIRRKFRELAATLIPKQTSEIPVDKPDGAGV